MTGLTYFPLLSGLTTVVMGCSIPVVDYYYSQYTQEQRRRTRTRTTTEDGENRSFWESDQWSMPMRYLGGVVGFAWAASVPPRNPSWNHISNGDLCALAYVVMFRLVLTSRD